MKMRKLGLLLLTTLGFFAQAKQLNQQMLDQMSEQALTSINQFIAHDPQSSLNSILDSKQITQLRQHIEAGNLPFATVVDAALIQIKEKGEHISLPYWALRHNIWDSPQSGLNLYEVLLRNNDNAAVYAFSHLDKLDLSSNPEWGKKRKQLHDRYGFSVQPAQINNEQKHPEICLEFSHRIRPEPAQNWQALINVTPKPRKATTYRGDELCFSGHWQTRYSINIDKQLQSTHLLLLNKNINETVYTGDRPPMIHFAASGSVLDAHGNRQLAISTANVDNVAINLWKISASSLSSDRIQSLIQQPQRTTQWKLGNILRRNAEKRFTGTFNVGDYKTNESITTNIAFDDLNTEKTTKAGIYVMTAKNADSHDGNSQIAFSLTNAGFSAYLTDEGLWAELRDLQTGKPISRQAVSLYAVNNSLLGTQKTDKKGIAHFPKAMVSGKDGLRPSHIIAEGEEYFSYLEIEDNSIDLSDKGLSGHIDNAPLSSWVWSDRGIYRPNDTAHLMWLLKDDEGKTFHSAPIWLELLKPNGQIMLDTMVKADPSGAYRFDYFLDASARHGNWTIKLSLGKDGVLIAEKQLPVSSIAPQQVEAKIKPITKPILANTDFNVSIQADWLYGAPASDLPANVYQTIKERKLTDNRWTGWQIGLHDEKRYYHSGSQQASNTDKQGSINFTTNTGEITHTTKPLTLNFRAHVTEPSGQYVHAEYDKAIHRQQPYIAIKNTGKKQVNIAMLDDEANILSGKANWQLYRVHYDYYWYKQESQWQYQHQENRELVNSGTIDLTANNPTLLDLPLDDGTWVLVVNGDSSEIAASMPLEFGIYASPTKGNSPDSIVIKTDKTRYADGETVTVHLTAPFDGKASVKLAYNDGLLEGSDGNYSVNFKDGKAELTFKWDKEWNKGLWLLTSAWNQNQKNAHNRRAIGLHWIGGDLNPYQLDVSAKLPDTILPNSTLTIPLKIPATQANSNTWAQVAVIDEGLYQLAQPSFTDPFQSFWNKKQLSLQFFDIWGDIIRQVEGRQAALRSGADDSSEELVLKAMPERDIQLVTYWSAPVQFDSNGNASVSLEIPQFNGRLRVMAAAWNDEKLGGYDSTLQVRSPLVANLYSPAYLSPGDSSSIRIRLHNTLDKEQTIQPLITPKGFTLSNPVSNELITIAANEEKWLQYDFSIPADEKNHRAEIFFNFEGDDRIKLKRFMDIRAKTTPQKAKSIISLAPNSETHLAKTPTGDFLERHLFLSTSAPYSVSEVLKDLSTYPYGCNEQITSKAWSNLLISDLKHHVNTDNWGTAASRKRDLFIAQSQLANHQMLHGGFSLWGDINNLWGNTWLSAYITDFLLDSQQAQQLGNPQSLKNALQHLRATVMRTSTDDESYDSLAYAHYVLAKAGESVQGATLRFSEGMLNSKGSLSLSTASLHTVSALVQHGEMTLAKRMLTDISAESYNPKIYQSTENHGNPLRNIAQSLYVAYQLQSQLKALKADAEMQTAVQKNIDILWLPLQEEIAKSTHYSTQDLHWLAALATQLPAEKTAEVMINNKPVEIHGSHQMQLTQDEAITLANTSSAPIFVTQTDWAFPETEEIVANGYRLSMHYEDEAGNPVEITQLKQNQQVFAIATIEIEETQKNSDILFAYPLPAGLSVEAFDKYKLNDREWYKNIKDAIFSENRDDRHVAAFNTEDKMFTHMFMLRATQKGTWNAPAHSVENMYQPQYRSVAIMPEIVVE